MGWYDLLHIVYLCACLALIGVHGAIAVRRLRNWGGRDLRGSVHGMTSSLMEACGASEFLPTDAVVTATQERVERTIAQRLDARRRVVAQATAAILCAMMLGAQVPQSEDSVFNLVSRGQALALLSLMLVSARDMFKPMRGTRWYSLLMAHLTLIAALSDTQYVMVMAIAPTFLIRVTLAVCCTSSRVVVGMNSLHLFLMSGSYYLQLPRSLSNWCCMWELVMLPMVVLVAYVGLSSMKSAVHQQMQVDAMRDQLANTAADTHGLEAEAVACRGLLRRLADMTFRVNEDMCLVEDVPRLSAALGFAPGESCQGVRLTDFMPFVHDRQRFSRQLTAEWQGDAPYDTRSFRITLRSRQNVAMRAKVVITQNANAADEYLGIVAIFDLVHCSEPLDDVLEACGTELVEVQPLHQGGLQGR